ncbi:MAG: sugar transferase [Patescibacteria group bacterium]
MKKSELVFTAILVPLDFLMLVGAGLSAYHLRTSAWVAQYRPVLFHLNLPFNRYLTMIVLVAFLMLIVFALVGLYRIKPVRRLLDDLTRVAIGVSAGIMTLVLYVFLRQELFNSRFLVLAGWLIAIIFVSFGRLLVSFLQKYLMKKYHYGAHRVLVVGQDGLSRRVIDNIKQEPVLGYQLIGNLIGPDIKKIRARIKNQEVDEIVLTDPDWPKERVLELISFAERNHLTFKFVPNLFQTLTTNTNVEILGDVPVIELKKTALDGWGRIIKRLFDVVFSLSFIIIFSPLYLLIVLMIKLDSAGPIIYKDYRYGYRKRKFVFYKFRTMKAELCDGEFGTPAGNKILKQLEKDQQKNIRQGGPLHKIKGDPRLTKLGKFLRKYSLDELPQFFNVLEGDMSIVGYRPHMSYEVEKYTFDQQRMFYIRPGITGLAQISGRSDLDFNEEVKLDVFYMENWSLRLDLVIILKTPFILLFKRYRV